jgi:hypothetical protein
MNRARFTGRRVAGTTLLAAALLFGGGALVRASIPDQGGIIHGCYPSNGTLRVVDSELGQTCKPNEKSLDWSRGSGSIAYQSVGFGHLTGETTPVVVAHLVLPPGRYSLVATVEINNVGPANVQIACFLYGGDALIALVHQTVPPASATASTFATLSTAGVVELPASSTVRVECIDQAVDGSPTALSGTLVATSVAEVVVQQP